MPCGLKRKRHKMATHKREKRLRLVQELVITGLAALAWYSAGAQGWGRALGVLSVVHHTLVYILGGTLLKK